jgi:hypothetical protein
MTKTNEPEIDEPEGCIDAGIPFKGVVYGVLLSIPIWCLIYLLYKAVA